MNFYLKCWIPSLSSYSEISELNIGQFTVLAKYMLNNDDTGINKTFENIIENNLQNKIIYPTLTKFDKWFIILFLRAVSISPTLFLQTKKKDNTECNIEAGLLDILTKLSEITIYPIPDLVIEDIKFKFLLGNSLYSPEYPVNLINELVLEGLLVSANNYKETILSQKNILGLVKKHLYEYDRKYSEFFIIQNKNKDLQLSPISVRLTDSLLFQFAKSIFLPFCKVLFGKKYALIKNLGMGQFDVDRLTFLEAQMYLNYYTEEESKKIKKIK